MVHCHPAVALEHPCARGFETPIGRFPDRSLHFGEFFRPDRFDYGQALLLPVIVARKVRRIRYLLVNRRNGTRIGTEIRPFTGNEVATLARFCVFGHRENVLKNGEHLPCMLNQAGILAQPARAFQRYANVRQ
jgi:hypothetical protein